MLESKYFCSIYGIIFYFENDNQIMEWIETNLAYSADKKHFYDSLILDSRNTLFRLIGNKSEQNEMNSISLIRTMKYISKKFGNIYDPKKELFRVYEDPNGLL